MHEETSDPAASNGYPPPLTAGQADQWRKRQRPMSLWFPLGVQVLVVVLMQAGAAWAGWSRAVQVSMLWGSLACLLPALLCVGGYQVTQRALSGAPTAVQATSGLISVFFWELVKVMLSVVLLLLAPRWLAGLHWLGMLTAFVVVAKAYWLAFLVAWLKQRSPERTVLKSRV